METQRWCDINFDVISPKKIALIRSNRTQTRSFINYIASLCPIAAVVLFLFKTNERRSWQRQRWQFSFHLTVCCVREPPEQQTAFYILCAIQFVVVCFFFSLSCYSFIFICVRVFCFAGSRRFERRCIIICRIIFLFSLDFFKIYDVVWKLYLFFIWKW